MPWVDAGASVSAAYNSQGLRHQAAEEARQRNRLFQRATEAYRRGDGALAKRLSQNGWRHDQNMRRLHAAASDRILRERSRHLGATSIDLHGQHITEAISRVEAFLDHHRRMQTAGEVTLIAGAGKHSVSARGQPKRSLRESLLGWLQRTQPRGSFRELKGDARGTFSVRI